MEEKSVNLSAITNLVLAGEGEIIQKCEVATITGLHAPDLRPGTGLHLE